MQMNYSRICTCNSVGLKVFAFIPLAPHPVTSPVTNQLSQAHRLCSQVRIYLDLVDLTNIGVAIDPNASKIARVRKTRKSGSAMPPFQMANKKNAATNAMNEIVARWNIWTITLLDFVINRTKAWLLAMAKTATLANPLRKDSPPIGSPAHMSNRIIINAIEVDVIANRVKRDFLPPSM